MASGKNLSNIVKTLLAAEAISAFRVVKLGTYNTTLDCPTMLMADAATDVAFGVSTQAVADATRGELQHGFGTVVEVEAGATVTAGAEVMVTTDGKVIDATGATARSVGIAIKGGANGEIIDVLWMPSLKGPANS